MAIDHPVKAVAVLGALLHHDPVQFRMSGRESHEAAEYVREYPTHLYGIAHVVKRRDVTQRFGEQAEEMLHGGLPERFFRIKVVVDLRLVRVRSLCDRPRRSTIETLGSELDERGLEQPLSKVETGPA